MTIPARDVESLLQKLNQDTNAYQEIQADTQSRLAARRWPLFSAMVLEKDNSPSTPRLPASAPTRKRARVADRPALIIPLARTAVAVSPPASPLRAPVVRPGPASVDPPPPAAGPVMSLSDQALASVFTRIGRSAAAPVPGTGPGTALHSLFRRL